MRSSSPSRRDVLKAATALVLGDCKSPPSLPSPKSSTMSTRSLMRLRLSTAPIQNVADGLAIFPIVGGVFEGERLRGKVLAGGSDWVRKGDDAVLQLDLHATLETDDGALIAMTFTGVRD